MATNAHRLTAFLILLAGVALFLMLCASPANAATTFTVNRTDDAQDGEIIDDLCDVDTAVEGNQCTLRAAIQEANSTANDVAGPDAINFNLPDDPNVAGNEVKTISPSTPLPNLTDPVIIDGYSQPGSSTSDSSGSNAIVKIELSGANAGAAATGLTITAADSIIKGLTINRFDQYGILIKGAGATNNKVEGNYIGTDASGTQRLGNFWAGVRIENASAKNTIGGTQPAHRNVVSGSSGPGVDIYGPGTTGNKVEGNYIGTDASGTQRLGNQQGVRAWSGASNSTIGGTLSGARNVISGNLDGVYISGDSTGSKVQGNFIGTDRSGTVALGNTYTGVAFDNVANSTIGGTLSGARNVISGNGAAGIQFYTVLGATNNKVEGNYIGTDASGTQDLGNSAEGVLLRGNVFENTIGGTASGARNVISGNGGAGVNVISGARDNHIEGNYIGTDASGTHSLGNSGSGVRIESGTGNSILSNSIFSNNNPSTFQSELGIDLGTTTGVTANDEDDPDAGANNLQNFPVRTSVGGADDDGRTIIVGELNTTPNKAFTIQLFANPSADNSTFGEGKTYLGQKTDIMTDASGNASFSLTTTENLNSQFVTATATSSTEGTSEFSKAVAVNEVNDPPVNLVPGPQNTNEDGTLVFSGDNANRILVSDPDAGSGSVMVRLQVDHGMLTLNGTGGLTFASGDSGTNDADMTFIGAISDINAALEGLRYDSDADYYGSATLSITTNDQGVSGTGGAKTDTDTVALTVQDTFAPIVKSTSPVNNATGIAPTANVDATFSEEMNEGSVEIPGAFTLKLGSSAVAATVSYDPTTKKATLDPSSDLEANTTYAATITGGSTGVKDLAGNALEQDYSWTFTTTADTTAPETTIDSGPSGTVSSTTASFGFASSEVGSTFQCSRDGSTFSACTSPKSYSSLSQGNHTFRVRAIDKTGNIDASPASRGWFVDTVVPRGTVSINGGAASTRSQSVTLSLSASDPSPASGVVSMRFRNENTATWSGWFNYSSSVPWQLSNGAGTKTVYAQFQDRAGNVSATAYDKIKFSP